MQSFCVALQVDVVILYSRAKEATGMDETETQLPKIRQSTAYEAITHEHEDLKLSAFAHWQPIK